MYALGIHLLLELKDCNSQILNDLKKVEDILIGAAKESKATIVETSFHKFRPFGISGMVIIAESHLSIHTWPEYGYAAIDVFTCGDVLKPEVAASYLIERFESKNPSLFEVKRGIVSRKGDIDLPYKPDNNKPADKGKEIRDVINKELQVVS
ncbi:MAG: adenosylmethionine decarboxylase [Nitrospirota bacterium]